MGENEQGGMLRTVVVVSLVAIITIVLVFVTMIAMLNLRFNTLAQSVGVSPVNVVKNTNYVNTKRDIANKNWDINPMWFTGRDKALTSALQSGMKNHKVTDFVSADAGFWTYVSYARKGEGTGAYDNPSLSKPFENGGYFDNTESIIGHAPQWNIQSITTLDGKTYRFDVSFNEKYQGGFENEHNRNIFRQIFDQPNADANTFASDSGKAHDSAGFLMIKSITYDNGLVISQGDSMLMTADITKASSLAVYTNSGAVNTALIDSDILKTLYNNPSSKARLTPFLGVNIKLRITYSHGWPFVDIVPSNNPMTLSNTSGIDMDSYYYYDKKSFINLSKRHATEWDKLVRFGLTK